MGVVFDAVGAGSSGALSSFSWSHTATAGAYVIVDIAIDRTASITSITYGGSAMTLLGSAPFNGVASNGSLLRYGKANVSGGAQTVSITTSVAVWGIANSVSYKNIGSVGTTDSTYGYGPTYLQNTYATGAQVVVESLASAYGPGGVIHAPSGGTNRYSGTASGVTTLAISDATTPTTFTDIPNASLSWGGLATTFRPQSFQTFFKGYGTYAQPGGGNYITDDFNRASLGSNWTNRLTPTTGFDIQIKNSNAMGISNVNNYAFAQYTAQDMAGDNVKITITIGPDAVASDYYLVGLRGNGTEVVYAYCAPNAAPSVYTHTAAGGDWRNMINGGQVSRASGPANVIWVAGDKLSFEARGNIYTIKRNDVVVCRWNDSGGTIFGSYVGSGHRQWGLGLGTNSSTTRGMIDSITAITIGVPPTPAYSDSFSTAYSNILYDDNWTNWSTYPVRTTSGRAESSVTGNWSVASYNWPMATDNHKISAVYVNPNTSFAATLYVRSNNSNQVFAYIIDTGNTTNVYVNTNTYAAVGGTSYASAVIDWADGDTASFEAIGYAYIVRQNGIAKVVTYDTNGGVYGSLTNAAHRDVGIGFLNNSGTATGWDSIIADDLPSNYTLPSQIVKSGSLAWATSSTWVDISTGIGTNDATFTTAPSGNGFIVLTSITSAPMIAQATFSGSTAARQHTIRIMRSQLSNGTADTTVVATSSTITGESGTCFISTTYTVTAGEIYVIQMNSDGASAGNVLGTSTTLTMGSLVAINDLNTTRTSETVPSGFLGCFVTLIGGGGGGGTGWGQAFANSPGGGGGGGAAATQRFFIPSASLGSTYSLTRGLGGGSATDGTDSVFTSGSVTITAGGGKKGGNATSTSVAGGSGAAGSASSSGVTGLTSFNGTTGGAGSSSGAGSAASNNTSGGAPGGGGGGFRTSGGGVNNGGSGGNSKYVSGATGAAGNGGNGTSAGAGQTGGGGAGSGSGNSNNFTAGNGGIYGAGGGGAGGDNSVRPGGTGANGYTLVEWVHNIQYENLNITGESVPSGATGCYVTLIGGGGGGGTGWGQAFSNAPGGGGGGGAAVVQRSFIAVADLGSTYSLTVGAAGAPATDGGDTTFTSGSVTITAGGGKKGSNSTSASVAGAAGAAGTATVSGTTGVTTVNGTAGGAGSNSGAGSTASNNSNGGAPGGGGGGFRNSGGGTFAGGSGGNSTAANGATGAAGNGGNGTSAGAGRPGGGGAGSGSGNGNNYTAGNGGTYGAGAGGGGGDNSARPGGTGGAGYVLIEWVF